MMWLSGGGGETVQQMDLAPAGVTFSEDVSHGRWVEESVSGWATVRSLLPEGFQAYARVFHPAYLGKTGEEGVRWSTVASWSRKVAHPLMQFPRIADLGRDLQDSHSNPTWGRLPRCGSLPVDECAALAKLLHPFTSTPDDCFFCLWEGYGNIDTRLQRAGSRVRTPGRDYLLFHGPLDAVTSFLDNRHFPFWGDSPNIWWPEDRAWCVATDIDLFDTYMGGSLECIGAILNHPGLEALPTTPDARVDMNGDT